MHSFIAWSIGGIEASGTACRESSRWRQLRQIAVTLAFFDAQPMKMGFRSSSASASPEYEASDSHILLDEFPLRTDFELSGRLLTCRK